MNVITRFAPSPTGLLHVGNIRTALINWLFAKKHHGKFILRMDDTDYDRSEEKFEQAIVKDLRWLGLDWDRLEHQKDRINRYEEIKQLLIKDGRLYPCYETEEDLEIKRKIRLSQGKPPVYDRAALALTEKQIFEYEQAGKRPHFRFKLDHKDVSWNDLIQGQVKMNAGSFSDPIVIRGNGTWTYLLCSIVDDIDFNVTHIIRGEDHISNTVAQIQFFEALKSTPPIFAHLARIVSKTEKISKRVGGFDIQTLRDEKEIEAMTINSFFALIGTSKDVSVCSKLEGLVNNFSIEDFHKSPINYEEADLVRLNHRIISSYSFEEIKDRLATLGLSDLTGSLWIIIRNNIKKLSEAKYWHDVCCGEIVLPNFSTSDQEFLIKASDFLPKESNWDEGTWDKWIDSIKLHTTRRGKELFVPLRLALTGVKSGPELKILLPMIGKERVQRRLRG
jgi:glutamyl-tRNA synthetase